MNFKQQSHRHHITKITQNRIFMTAWILITLAFLAAAFLNHVSFHLPWEDDMSVIGNVTYNITNHSNFNCNAIANCFGYEHFRAILLLLSPFYLLNQDIFTIIALGIIGVSVMLFLLLQIAEDYFDWKIVLALAAFFLIHPATLNMFLRFNARDSLFVALFAAMALYAYHRRTLWLFILSLILLALPVEYAALLGMGFGFLALFHRRSWPWIVFPLAFGVIYFIGINNYVMPYLNHTHGFGGVKFKEYAYLGNSLGAIVIHLVAHPIELFQIIFTRTKIELFVAILAPLLFVPILGIEYLLVPLFYYPMFLLPKPDYYANINWYYFSPIMPLVFMATIVGLKRLINFFHKKSNAVQWAVVGVSVAFIALNLNLFIFWHNLPDELAFLPVIRRTDWTTYREQSMIPPDQTVSAQYPFIGRYSARDHVYLFPDNVGLAAYIVVGIDHDRRSRYPLTSQNYVQTIEQLLNSGHYGVFQNLGGGDFILKKGQDNTNNNQLLSALHE